MKGNESKRPKKPLRELHPDPHDYEPASMADHGPMATDPDCRICGQPHHWHK